MIEQRLSLITLGVLDLDRSIAFYEAFGWTRSMKAAEGVAFFQMGGFGLSLYPDADLAADAGVTTRTSNGFRGVSLGHNVRERHEVDSIFKVMVAAGGTLLKAPEEKFWGGYGAYVADPDGHAWEIAWNPGFPIDSQGNISIPA